MFVVFLNAIFMLVIYNCHAIAMDEEVTKYFKHPDRQLLQNTWMKYKKGFETSLEQMLQENYNEKGMNVFKRRLPDFYKLTEGFMTVADPVLQVVFRELYLLELPMMRSPKVLFTLGSNMLKVDAELLKVKILAKYIVYRNDSVITFASGRDMFRVSPFSLRQVHTTGEVTIIGEECRLTGHAVATLSDQSVNLGHNTFSLTDCKFSLEIWTPSQGTPPIFTRYFQDCDRNFLQNLISKPLQDELMSKLQGSIFSYVNTTEIFGLDLHRHRARQTECFKKVNLHMTEVVTNMNAITAVKTQGVRGIDMKVIGWTEAFERGTLGKSVVISNVILYGLDTAYTGHTGGPIEQNGQMFIEDTIGFNTLQVTGTIVYQSFHSKSQPPRETISKFSAEIHDLTVVVRVAVADGLKASNLDSTNKDNRSWYTPRIRNFELNLFEISEIWARSLVTAYLTNEIYTSVVMSILNGQLNEALEQTAKGIEESVINGGVKKPNEDDHVYDKPDKDTKISKDSDGKNLDNEKTESHKKNITLWKSKKGDVVLTIEKDKVRVEKGTKKLFEVNNNSIE